MLRTSALAIAVAIGFAGAATAQTVRPPMLPAAVTDGLVLVKHDGKHDNGRHLGWYKQRGREATDEDDNEDGGRRAARRAARGTTSRGWVNPYAPYSPYYAAPGYGSSYPPPYGYYPPPYYRGY